MMQRLACVSLSDPAHLDKFTRDHGDLVDVAAEFRTGGWGLGLWRSGEMLTRKTPISSSFDGLAVIQKAAVRQFVVVAEENAALRSSRSAMQPLRFRNWAFAVTGTVVDRQAFIRRAGAGLAGFGKSGPTLHELAQTTMMHALHRANALDRPPLSTSIHHAAITRGVERLQEFAGGGKESLQLAMALLVNDHLFQIATGRPLYVHECSDKRSRTRLGSWSATVVTDFEVQSTRPVETLEWTGLEVDSHGRRTPFDVV